MKQITSILIGAGLRGGYVYSQYALDHPDEFKVIAVAEPDQERRELFAAKHNIPKELQYESYEELLQQDKMADCAMICTQDKMHYEPVTMAMQKDIMFFAKADVTRQRRNYKNGSNGKEI